MAGVFVPPGAAAGRFAASAVDGHQAGSQKGPLGLELLETGVEGPLDQGGVGGDFHAGLGGEGGLAAWIVILLFRNKAKKAGGEEKP